ncbi:MAG TPA: protein kinase, partial [Myxococcaceae bacterium]
MLGTIVDGRYLLVSLLGQGGMGRVYEAQDQVTGQRVALKVIDAQAQNIPMLAARLQREAHAASVIRSPHVAQLLSSGTDSATGAPYAVFEYLAGTNLQKWFDDLGPLPPDLALRIAIQASIGIESVHAAGFIHRDIKPSNLFLQEVGEERIVKLLDFGLVRPRLDAPELEGWNTLTRSGGLIGSPLYLSPEQAQGGEVDHRSDIWSLGVLLYKALAGLTPHEGLKSLGELIIAICQRRARPVSARAPWVPAELSRILEKALEIEPGSRFQHISELRGALSALLPGGTAIQAAMLTRLETSDMQPRHAPRKVRDESQLLAEAHERTATVASLAITQLKAEPPLAQLPSPVNRLIGRDRESSELGQLVPNCRLVTLLGPGGTGKTRLAIHVAAQLAGTFAHGAGFVDLSPITDAEGIPRAIAAALNIREEPERSLRETLVLQLRAKHLLLVLDNCEHLVTACAEYVEPLLAACPRLWIIATSREPLAIVAETTFLVAPLSIPEQSAGIGLEQIAKTDSVRLFVERAQSVNPSFTLSSTNVGQVAHICRQLDGIPLALELAAARMRAMSAEQLAAQIDDRFRILSGVRRGASRRQQTLRALIDWSHDLLAEPERAVLRRLSVFQGGFSVPAAEAVCEWEGDPLGIAREQVF